MKAKVINKNTNQQFDCEEIEIKDFKYYTIDTAVGCKYGISKLNEVVEIKVSYDAILYKGIICSNNPNIDIPKVMDDELTIKVNEHFKDYWKKEDESKMKGDEISTEMMTNMLCEISAFTAGYKKSQETHPFSEDDMIEFSDWIKTNYYCVEIGVWIKEGNYFTTKELLQIWKEQQSKIVFYE